MSPLSFYAVYGDRLIIWYGAWVVGWLVEKIRVNLCVRANPRQY